MVQLHSLWKGLSYLSLILSIISHTHACPLSRHARLRLLHRLRRGQDARVRRAGALQAAAPLR